MSEISAPKIRKIQGVLVSDHLDGVEPPDECRDLWWIILPHVSACLELVDLQPTAVGGAKRRTAARMVLPSAGPKLHCVGPVQFVSSGVQSDRVIVPVCEALKESFGGYHIQTLPRINMANIGKIRETVDMMGRFLDSSGLLDVPFRSSRFYEDLWNCSLIFHRALALFRKSPARQGLVIAHQHGAAERAVALAAVTAGGVHTFYMHHAPLANNRYYHDLPTHWGLLRGPEELKVFDSLGAKKSRIFACGDPSVGDQSFPKHRGGSTVLFAQSPVSRDDMINQIAVIADAGVPQVEVALHPRTEREAHFSSMFPQDWSWRADKSTFARMASPDVRAVVQSQSGVGLEALCLGLPLINLVARNEPNNYYYMDSSHVVRASGSTELAEALDNLEEVDTQSEKRHEYALSWMGQTGTAAAEAIGETIVRTLDEQIPSELALNGWGVDPFANLP